MLRLAPPTPVVRVLLVGLGAAYVASVVAEVWLGIPVTPWLALNVAAGSRGTLAESLARAVGHQEAGELPAWGLWQVATHTLVEPTAASALVGVLVTFFFLAWILTSFEQRFGSRRTWQLFVVATLTSGVAGFAVGRLLGPSAGYAMGTGPVLYAAFVALAFSLPRDAPVLLYGVLPVRNVHGLALAMGLSVLFFLVTRNAVTFAADLAAVATGWGLARWMQRTPRRRLTRDAPRRAGGNGRRPLLHVIPGGRDDDERPRWLN
ncbi:MAG: rhomboid family intramembrane serine protease [Myxococcota bacterium]|nr:rhomboid family intramembrane serine protease [Myxococcota bacterium]